VAQAGVVCASCYKKPGFRHFQLANNRILNLSSLCSSCSSSTAVLLPSRIPNSVILSGESIHVHNNWYPESSTLGEEFFSSIAARFGLAPKKKQPSLQVQMASNVESLAAEFKGFDMMIKQMLNKLNSFEAWRTTTDASLGVLLTKTTEVVVQINRLEAAPPPPPPHPPAGWNLSRFSKLLPQSLCINPRISKLLPHFLYCSKLNWNLSRLEALRSLNFPDSIHVVQFSQTR
jgi:hypothetical protein